MCRKVSIFRVVYGSIVNDSDNISGITTTTRFNHGLQNDWGNFNFLCSREQSDGYRDTTESNTNYLNARMRLPVSTGILKISAGIEKKSFGANDFYGNWPSKEWTTAGIYTAQFEKEAIKEEASSVILYTGDIEIVSSFQVSNLMVMMPDI